MIKNVSVFLLVLAVAVGIAGCEKTQKAYPSQSMSVNPATQPDGNINLGVYYTILNQSNKPVTYKFTSDKQFDVWLVVDGKEIARESTGKTYKQTATSFTLKPGENKTFTTNLLVDPKSFQITESKFDLHAELVGQKNMSMILRVEPTAAGFVVVPVVK